MKSKSILFIFLLFVLFPCSCKEQAKETILVVETTQINFSAEQNSRTISCSSKAPIEVESSQPSWCTVKVVAWNNATAIELSVPKNFNLKERTATISVSSGNAKAVQIEVKQASGSPFFAVEANSSQHFTPQAAQRQMTVNANVPFTATSTSPSWCMVSVDPDATSDNLTVTVTENEGMNERYAEIVVAATGFNNAVINVVQRTSYIPDPEEPEVFDDAGHRIFSKAVALTWLNRTGPFIRLSDGSMFQASATSFGTSKDDGRTWTQYPYVDLERFLVGSPVSTQTRKGTIIVGFYNPVEQQPLNWNNTTHTHGPNAKLPAYIMYSRNNGQTWSEPLKLHDEWTGMNRGILETKDGHIVFSTMIMRNNPGRHCVLTYVSSDDGETWTPSNVLDDPSTSGHHGGLMEAAILQLNDGRIWMLIRTNWDYFYESFSSNNGLTWSAPQKTDIDASSAPAALLRLQSGRIILVWNRLYHKGKNTVPRFGGDRNLSEVACSWQRDELSVMYSDDDAKTWSTPFVIAENVVPVSNPLSNNIWLSYPYAFEHTKGIVWITDHYGKLRIAIREDDLPK